MTAAADEPLSEEDKAFDALSPIDRVRTTVDAYRYSIAQNRNRLTAEYREKGLEANPSDLWDLGRLEMLDRIAAVMDDREGQVDPVEQGRLEERERIVALLQRLAAGRLEYGKRRVPEIDATYHVAEWSVLEGAARAVTDPGVVFQMVPSWLWTDEEIREAQGGS